MNYYFVIVSNVDVLGFYLNICSVAQGTISVIRLAAAGDSGRGQLSAVG